MILSRYNLKNITAASVIKPDETIFDLPEKVLQFGTGVLLRGLPGYYIDKANRQGIFNGRVVVVKSTAQGDATSFEKQDGLYTTCIRGYKNGTLVEENVVNSSISRVLNAAQQWQEVLACAHNANMQIIISNTTEVGIQMCHEDIRHHPPQSFPGKLLSFLHERFKAFAGSRQSGMTIIPTELIPENGKKLEAIILEMAHLNGLEEAFIEWVEKYNCFCNSLVDRIVPGKPEASILAAIENELGYSDSLLLMSEPYGLWAIEGDEGVKQLLSFAQADEGVVIEPDINLYRELKLRLLNGTHTLSCGLAYLAGCKTVQQAMEDETISTFIADIMQNEIVPVLNNVDSSVAQKFAATVLDRFRNNHIRHEWLNITLQYSSKMRLRCLPVLLEHYQRHQTVPALFVTGFAAYLYFMKPVEKKGDEFFGEYNGEQYKIKDEQAEVFYKRWAGLTVASLVHHTLQDEAFWGTPLHHLPGFEQAVTYNLNEMINEGVRESLEKWLPGKEVAA